MQFDLNKYNQPIFEIPGDREDKIIMRNATIRAATKTKSLWIAGFLSGSDAAKAYGCSTKAFYWLVCDNKGKVLDKYVGFYMDLPEKFKKFLKK